MTYTTVIFVAVTVTLLVSSTYAQWTPSPLCPFPSEDLTRFPYEGDCSKYWECYEGARYPMDCPSGLEFNSAESRCDSPDIANCYPDATIIYPTFSHSVSTTPSRAPTPDPGPRPECPFPSNEITFYPVVNNCAQYWECYQGNRYLMNCPAGQYWNTKFNTCDYAYNVECHTNNSTTTEAPTTTPGNNTSTSTPGSTVTPVPTPTTTANPIDKLCDGEPDGTYLRNPDNCHRFYECVGGKAIEGQCSGNLVWNEDILSCDYPENVTCVNGVKRKFR